MVLDFFFIIISNVAVNLDGYMCLAENQNKETYYILVPGVWEPWKGSGHLDSNTCIRGHQLLPCCVPLGRSLHHSGLPLFLPAMRRLY